MYAVCISTATMIKKVQDTQGLNDYKDKLSQVSLLWDVYILPNNVETWQWHINAEFNRFECCFLFV